MAEEGTDVFLFWLTPNCKSLHNQSEANSQQYIINNVDKSPPKIYKYTKQTFISLIFIKLQDFTSINLLKLIDQKLLTIRQGSIGFKTFQVNNWTQIIQPVCFKLLKSFSFLFRGGVKKLWKGGGGGVTPLQPDRNYLWKFWSNFSHYKMVK